MNTRYDEKLRIAPERGDEALKARRGFTSGPLEVNVIFTDLKSTAAALSLAQSFARELGARILLRAAIEVPIQLPIEKPPIPVSFLQERLLKLVLQLECEEFKPRINLYLCRDRTNALLLALRPNSLVLVGGPKRWWPTQESRLARALRAKGHRVIFVDSNARSGAERSIFHRLELVR